MPQNYSICIKPSKVTTGKHRSTLQRPQPLHCRKLWPCLRKELGVGDESPRNNLPKSSLQCGTDTSSAREIQKRKNERLG